MANNLLSLNISGIEALSPMQQLANPARLEKVLRSSLAYASRSVPLAVGRAVSARYGITSTRVRQDSFPPVFSGSGEDFVATLRFSRRPPTGMQYRPREVGPNLRLGIFRRGQPTIVQHGFVGTMRGREATLKPDPSTAYGPDLQAGRARPRRGLDVVYGPSVGSAFLGQSTYGEEIRKEVSSRIQEQFEKGVDRALRAIERGHMRR